MITEALFIMLLWTQTWKGPTGMIARVPIEADRIELARMQNGQLVAQWYAGGRLCDVALVPEERLLRLLGMWPRLPVALHGSAVVFAEILWAEGFTLRPAAD